MTKDCPPERTRHCLYKAEDVTLFSSILYDPFLHDWELSFIPLYWVMKHSSTSVSMSKLFLTSSQSSLSLLASLSSLNTLEDSLSSSRCGPGSAWSDWYKSLGILNIWKYFALNCWLYLRQRSGSLLITRSYRPLSWI